MPNLTPNYSLKKPLGTEPAKIADLNDNADILDTALTPNVNDAISPTSASTGGKVADVLSWLCNRIKAITGKSNWYTAPATTLEQAHAHITNGTHAIATPTANGFMSSADKKKLDDASASLLTSTLVLRDSFGRAKVTTPSSASDIATKGYVDGLLTRQATKGTYTGNGQKYQYISLPFTPSRVQVICETASNTAACNGIAMTGCPAQTGTYAASVLTPESVVAGQNHHYVKVLISGNGFYVCYCSATGHARTNESGKTYHYYAEKD